MADRGLVITLPLTVTTTGMSAPTAFDPIELRAWLLHWDKLDFPISVMAPLAPSAEVDFLLQSGVMQRTLADPSYEKMDKAHPNDRGYSQSTIDAFRLLDKNEPGAWSLGYSRFNMRHPRQSSFAFRSDVREDSGFFADEDDEAGRGILVDLIGSLPVPERDVRLEDVLEFKRRRRAEMLALRAHLESVYQSIKAAPDKPLAQLSAVEALQKGIADVLKSGTASPVKFKLIDLNARLNLASGATEFVHAQAIGLPLLASLAAGAVKALELKIGPSVSVRERRDSPSPFEYVASYQREF